MLRCSIRISSQPRPAVSRVGRSGEANRDDEIHACAGRGVDACADGCGFGRAGASGDDDRQGYPVQLQPGHDRERVDAVRHRGRRGCWREPERSDLLRRRLQRSVLSGPLCVRQAQRLAEPQLGRQPVLCWRHDPEPACQLQRRRKALHHASEFACLLHRSADRSFGAARRADPRRRERPSSMASSTPARTAASSSSRSADPRSRATS